MKIRYVIPALAAAAALALTGCTNTEGGDTTSPTKVAEGIQPDAAAVALLPAAVKDSGTLRIGTDAAYPPNEYKDSNGNPTGWGVELANAVAAKLGLKPEWQILDFDSILPRIEGGDLDMGSSSFTDNLLRQKTVDFVDFLDAGSMWAAPKGKAVNPDDACGLTVAVQQGTVQDTNEMSARNKKCAADGKPEIKVLRFDGQPEATNSVINGQADAFSADFPVTLDAVDKSDGQLETVGAMFDTSPYGFAVPKGSGMAEAVQAALKSLMADGTYLKILTNAGVESGAVKEIAINGGTDPGTD